MANADYEVRFHDAIITAIPLLFQRLTDVDEDVRLETVELIGKLANDGESQSDTTVPWLMQIIKSGFMTPSQS
jgi:hypothetical protein